MSADTSQLSRRERQIMDVVYHHTGGATATQVYEEMTDPPTRTAVRTFLRILEEKGYVEHRKAGREFVYRPTRPRGIEGRSALRHVLQTFFDGSLERAVGAYLHGPGAKPDADELKRLASIIQEAKKAKPKSAHTSDRDHVRETAGH
jgi:BlaI family transcriptional regulator, penicillinase repressor